jgi:hypothetical protein
MNLGKYDKHSCYIIYIHRIKMSRADAENACNALGKTLATIEALLAAKSFTDTYLLQRKEIIMLLIL